ncbi:MAG TPA: hypothetical protein VG963_20110 [Polyangiaceae bacterium]|nr:hypothetical protein [Polyangiaceae bacterium]
MRAFPPISLAELQAAAGDDPSVPAELWFSALLDALSPPEAA